MGVGLNVVSVFAGLPFRSSLCTAAVLEVACWGLPVLSQRLTWPRISS